MTGRYYGNAPEEALISALLTCGIEAHVERNLLPGPFEGSYVAMVNTGGHDEAIARNTAKRYLEDNSAIDIHALYYGMSESMQTAIRKIMETCQERRDNNGV